MRIARPLKQKLICPYREPVAEERTLKEGEMKLYLTIQDGINETLSIEERIAGVSRSELLTAKNYVVIGDSHWHPYEISEVNYLGFHREDFCSNHTLFAFYATRERVPSTVMEIDVVESRFGLYQTQKATNNKSARVITTLTVGMGDLKNYAAHSLIERERLVRLCEEWRSKGAVAVVVVGREVGDDVVYDGERIPLGSEELHELKKWELLGKPSDHVIKFFEDGSSSIEGLVYRGHFCKVLALRLGGKDINPIRRLRYWNV